MQLDCHRLFIRNWFINFLSFYRSTCRSRSRCIWDTMTLKGSYFNTGLRKPQDTCLGDLAAEFDLYC